MEKIIIEQLGTNEYTFTIGDITKNREFVRSKEVIGEAETSKAVFEIYAPIEGYVYWIVEVDDEVQVGQTIAFIGEKDEMNFDFVHITERAQKLADRMGVNTTIIKKNGLITVDDVLKFYKESD